MTTPRVAADGSGNFQVMWNYYFQYFYTRRVNSSGVPQASQVQIGASAGFYAPAIACDSAGNFTAVWTDNFDNATYGQRFDASGSPIASRFNVLSGEQPAAVASGATGNSVVAWPELTDDGVVVRIRIRRVGRFRNDEERARGRHRYIGGIDK